MKPFLPQKHPPLLLRDPLVFQKRLQLLLGAPILWSSLSHRFSLQPHCSIAAKPPGEGALRNACFLGQGGRTLGSWCGHLDYHVFLEILRVVLHLQKSFLPAIFFAQGGTPLGPCVCPTRGDKYPDIVGAFAGWLLAARTNGSSPGIGVGMLFEAFAAVVIGGVSLQGGVGNLTGVFAGAILLSAISTAISILGMPPFYMNIIRGGFIIFAVLIDAIITRVRPRLMR